MRVTTAHSAGSRGYERPDMSDIGHYLQTDGDTRNSYEPLLTYALR